MKRSVLLLVSLLLLLASCASGKSYLLDDYVSIVPYGINGQGHLKVMIDPVIMDILDEETDLTEYEINKLYDSMKLNLAEDIDSLSNGDVIPLQFTYSDSYGIDFQTAIDSITIEGLPDELVLSDEDLWNLIDIEVRGLNGQAELAQLKLESDNPAINKLQITPDTVNYLSTGDVITIDIETDPLFEASGYKLENPTLTYEVGDLDQLIFDLSMMTSDHIEQLDDIGKQTIEDYFQATNQLLYMTDYVNLVGFSKEPMAIDVLAEDYEMSDLELVSVALITYFNSQYANPFDTDLEKNANQLFLVYETTLQFDGQLYEEIKIGINKHSLVSRKGELVIWDDSIPEEYRDTQYQIYDIRNDRGDYVTQYAQQHNQYGDLFNYEIERYRFEN